MARHSTHPPARPVQSELPLLQRALGYARVSTDTQSASGISLEEQQRKIEARSLENGWHLERVYIDAGISGSTPLGKRPEGAKLLAAVRPGDVVVAAKMDRCFRSAFDALETIASFKRRKISLWLLDLGNDCSGNGISELIVTVLAAVARFECSLISERIKDAKRQLRATGRHQGGDAPFGWRVVKEGPDDGKLVPDPEEQRALEDMARMKAEGASLRTIANTLKARGLTISHQSVKRALDRTAETAAGEAA
jgi:DNA invertase Pin-like site-specific DNA recombinase